LPQQKLGRALGEATRRLAVRDRDEARYDATLLLAHVLGCDPAWLLAHDDAILSHDERERIDAALARRERGEPVPYIIGTAGFYGRTFAVDARVLVPRPETERAIDIVLAHARGSNATPRVCDVGTGSGAIALTLALELADADVTAIDISEPALAVARGNAAAFGIADRIRFVCGDGLRALDRNERFTCIVANLPYVRTADLAPAPDPTAFEPRLALDGGADGLDAYRALLLAAPDVLAPGGLLVMEAGPDTVPALAALARLALPNANVATVRDLAALERFVVVDDAGLDRAGGASAVTEL
jgi:release factor glutamine methyltransferase